MLAILITLRDALIAAALAWVGVTMERAHPDAACAGERCHAEHRN